MVEEGVELDEDERFERIDEEEYESGAAAPTTTTRKRRRRRSWAMTTTRLATRRTLMPRLLLLGLRVPLSAAVGGAQRRCDDVALVEVCVAL